MTLYLIRHGMTEANLRHVYCGSTDLPLSPQGRDALQALSAEYTLPACRVITSGMLRAEQTARLLLGDAAFEAEPRLREMDFGRFEMHSYNDLREDPDYIAWISGDNERNLCPGGESGEQMESRVISALEDLLARDEDVIVVTHGGPIAAIMAHLFPKEGKNRYQWQPKPGMGYRIEGAKYGQLP